MLRAGDLSKGVHPTECGVSETSVRRSWPCTDCYVMREKIVLPVRISLLLCHIQRSVAYVILGFYR
jgi:hypothetical protein